jgi:uncharacterized protein YqhQ
MLAPDGSPVAPRPYVGGQAILEGVFMRAPRAVAMSVRRPSGEIVTDVQPYQPFFQRSRALRAPLLRGVFIMIDSLVLGMRALSWSAEQAAADDDDSTAGVPAQPPAAPRQASLRERAALTATMLVSLALGVLLFVAAPHLLTAGAGWLTGHELDVEGPAFHLVDGAIKLAIFFAYLALIRRSAEIRRVFAYHGAEHKTIHAYEAGLPLSIENVRCQSRLHPRCGTSFLLFVVGISILVFAAAFPLLPTLPVDNRLLASLAQVAIKLPLTLPVAAVSYEIIRLTSRFYTKPSLRWLAAPGLAMQRLTTEEPDDRQLEVAIAALNAALAADQAQGGQDLGLEGAAFSTGAAVLGEGAVQG